MQSTHIEPRSNPSPPSSAGAIDGRRVIDGRYELRRLLAAGGGAEVFAAEHCFTKRPVAVKLPFERSRCERVYREIEALSRVSGGGVVELLDAGEADGRPFIAFELLEGRTLGGLLAARGKLAIQDALRVGLELSATLSRCHAAGVIHRDVKPSNVFTTLQPSRQVVLLDFGIAKLMSDADPELALTRETSLLGTPEYMAPESLLASRDADHRVDVYGLGVVLYECLTGAVPFDGKHSDVLSKISMTAPLAVSDIRRDMPADFARVVMRCLNRLAADRFPTMEAVHSALRACGTLGADAVHLLAGVGSGASGREEPVTLADAPASIQNPASRRKHTRVPYTALARVRLDGGHVDGRIEEISEGGFQFVGERAIERSTYCTVRFALPASGRMVELPATSRWNRTVRGLNATGLQFEALSDAARDEIARYVALMSGAVR